MNARPRSARPLSGELRSLALVLAAPALVAGVFPYSAVRFRAARTEPATAARCAFVTLTAADEEAAIEDARTSWKANAEGVRRMRADLSLAAIPDEPIRSVVTVEEREPCPPPRSLRSPLAPLPPTVAAPEPERLPPETRREKGAAAFSRREMLKLD